MPHLLDSADTARIRIQAEFENIYDKTSGFITNNTETNSLNAFKAGLKELSNGITAVDQQGILYSIGNIAKKGSNVVLQYLKIELPGTNNELNEVTQQIRMLIENNLKSEYSLVPTDAPKDTCTSIVYELRCVPDCTMRYIGRTHEGMNKRWKFITKNCNSKTKQLLEKHMEEKHNDTNLSTIDNNWDRIEIAASCEDDKLKILESLHIKKLLLSGHYLLNTSPKKGSMCFSTLIRSWKQLSDSQLTLVDYPNGVCLGVMKSHLYSMIV